MATWESLLLEKAWENLREIIKAPINIEAALEHLAEEKYFDAETFEDEIDTSEESQPMETDVNLVDSPDEPIQPADSEQTPDPTQQEST